MQVVKRKGHSEPFDDRKLYGSIFAACMSLRMSDHESELLSETVTSEVKQVLKESEKVEASVIHAHTAKSLHRYNPDAAFLYDTHRDIS